MKAAFYTEVGSARDVLQVADLPRPSAAAGEVLVRVYASGVNPSDVKARAGRRAGASGLPWPHIIPHSDGAGVIEAVGSGVDPARVGQRVWLWNGQWQRPYGTAAEYIALPSAQAVPLPESTGYAEAACLGIPALTAHRCVHADGPIAGQTVLVTGGAGTVGRYAIQMAKLAGAQVITTISGPEKAAHARSAGADHVINYRDQDVIAQVRSITGIEGVHRIIDVEFGDNIAVTSELIANNGTIVSYGSAKVMSPQLPFYPLMFKAVTIRLVLIYILPESENATAIADLTGLLETGQLSHAVAEQFPLHDIASAHESVERAEKLGSVVVTL